MNKEVTFRLADLNDAQAILEIYKPYILNTAVTFEIEVPALAQFEKRMAAIMEKYPYIAALINDEIVGYGYVSAFKDRAAYDYSAETSIYIAEAYQRQGIGRNIYLLLEEICKDMNICNLNACLAYSEEDDEYLTKDSLHFHEEMGYHLSGHFEKCAYKFGKWYDMIWLEKHLLPHSDTPENVEFLTGEKREKIAEIINNFSLTSR